MSALLADTTAARWLAVAMTWNCLWDVVQILVLDFCMSSQKKQNYSQKGRKDCDAVQPWLSSQVLSCKIANFVFAQNDFQRKNASFHLEKVVFLPSHRFCFLSTYLPTYLPTVTFKVERIIIVNFNVQIRGSFFLEKD